MMMNQKYSNKELEDLLIVNFEKVLAYFDINNIKKTSNFWHGPCPIHDNSDNDLAFNFYHEEARSPGYWACNTKCCNEGYAKNIFGFVKALIKKKTGEDKKFNEVINICYKILETSKQIKLEKIKRKPRIQSFIDEGILKSNLKIPSPYFIKRGFSKEILERYNVGDCWNKGKMMYLRAVVPVKDELNRIVGVTGRSFFDICPKCECYHWEKMKCPDHNKRHSFSKWKNSFEKSHYLYNYNLAKKTAIKNNLLILVEGPSDVWKLVQYGIYNVVALFGLIITQEQVMLCSNLGIENIMLFVDNDEAGTKSLPKLAEMLNKFKLYYPSYKEKEDIKKIDYSRMMELINDKRIFNIR